MFVSVMCLLVASIWLFSAFGYMVGSEVSDAVHKLFGQQDSWRWALRVSDPLMAALQLVGHLGRGNAD